MSDAFPHRSPRRARAGTRERGVGLVEVLIALSILVFGALVTARMQVGALSGLHAAGFHFAVDRLSGEMIETLRSRSRAAADGLFDHDAGDPPIPDDTPGRLAAAWSARVRDAIPTGESAIDCADGLCTVEISWMEEIDGINRRQRFRARTPL